MLFEIKKNLSNAAYFDVRENLNLECIEVDDIDYSDSNWSNISSNSYYSTSCQLSSNDDEIELLPNSYNVYSNPMDQELAVELGEVYEQVAIEAYNYWGQMCFSGQFTFQSKNQFPLTGGVGLFIIKIKTEENECLAKVLKQ